MENFADFVLARYNYWIVIILMMTGLYIVFARGNLVKKIVGLNVFQTSVFIFYITIGKISGGTAPIYMGGELEHGGGHGEDAGGHGEAAGGHGPEATTHAANHDGAADAATHGGSATGVDLHAKVDNTAATNDLKTALNDLGPRDTTETEPSLHDVPVADASKISNDALEDIAKPHGPGFEAAGDHGEAAGDVAGHGADGVHDAGHDVVGGAVEAIIYTNPLPHVLILTAIVVGVATTAVGLALAVRIREAYGTIEEDELETIDNIAEFGEDSHAVAGSAA